MNLFRPQGFVAHELIKGAPAGERIRGRRPPKMAFSPSRALGSPKQRAAEAAARQALIDEITVTAKRGAKVVRFGSVFGFLTTGASIAAEVAREVSQQRLDESFRRFESVQPRPKDSPLQTISDEVIPEIVVTAKRKPQRPRLLPTFAREIGDVSDRFLRETRPGFPSQIPTAPPIRLDAPTKPKQKTPKKPNLFRFTNIDPTGFVGPSGRPGSSPRSFLLGIGSPRPGTRPITPTLTAFQPQTLPSEQARSTRCPPCKKPKEKSREKCWKKLVKEGRMPSKDIEHKWVEINCDTGREL